MEPLAITLGDPAGIGAEVVAKAIEGLDVPVWLFGSRAWANQSWPVPPNVRFYDVRPGEERKLRFGEIAEEYGRCALDSIEAAVTAIERGECSGLVTAPIHKQSIALAGAAAPGHTELLAHRAGLTRYGRDFAMYFDSPSLRTILLTVHLPLREAIDRIDAVSVEELAVLTAREYRRLYDVAPRIAVAGVNPHAGEGGRFGSEEEVIAQGVDAARRRGIEIEGPLPPDTVFMSTRNGKYDVVMAMYHDQGLIPVKTLDFDHSVNVTLGLPYLRVSVDHGTAFDIAGRGIADAQPMRYAIEWAARHAERWTR